MELCNFFGYSRSGYYKCQKLDEKKYMQEYMIVKKINEIRGIMPKIGGKKLYKLLQDDLSKFGYKIGRDRFFDILRTNNLLVIRKRKYVRTTNSFHRFYKYKNKLKGRLLSGSNQAYVNDITYLRTRRGFVYLFLQTDAHSRKITGWHLSESLAIEGAIQALKMTLSQVKNPHGIIHHSDRGIQYCSPAYTTILKKHNMEISMTEENHCYENATAERVNGILKDEFLLEETFDDVKIARKAVKEAIESYNNKRPHWALNLSTPNEIHQAA